MTKKEINAVEIKNISFSYTKNDLSVNDVSFNIPQSRYICILGHNGSGKSTLSKILMGILLPSNGQIYYFGKNFVEKDFTEIRKHLGIVFQNPDNQFIGNSVEDDIAFGLENRCLPSEEIQKKVLEAAHAVKMEHKLKSKPEYLSGGQKQKVAIASTIALEADILIFDEVTSMLDPISKKEVNALMMDMCKKHKKTVISITHNMEEAILADYIFVLEKGKLVLEGKPETIFLSNIDKLHQYRLELPFAINLSKKLNAKSKKYSVASTLEEVINQI